MIIIKSMKRIILCILFIISIVFHSKGQEQKIKNSFLSNLDIGIGVTSELNVLDQWVSLKYLQYSIQANANYQISKQFKFTYSSSYGLDNDNFFKHNLDVAWMLISVSESSKLGIYSGFNVFQGKKYEILGSNYRSKSILGYNMGLMYDLKIFNKSFNSFLKYTNGFADLTKSALFAKSGYQYITLGLSINFQLKKSNRG